MAILKLYNDIQTDEQKQMAKWWGEVEGTSFTDVASFCEAIPESDNKIELYLHCNGGSVTEGWSIYDRLRATGKEIYATVEGKAASMATVIMMAAPKANRKSYESAEILIHNPFILTGGAFTADELAKLEKEMRTDQEKILNLYVERCSDEGDDEEKKAALREELQKIMDEDIYITPEKAKELGLISEIIPPKSAKAGLSSTFNKNKNNMAKNDETTEVKQSLLDRMLAKLGFKSIEDVKFGMDLNTADGGVITIEREEGEPQVGDKASPDGEHAMPDGTTIVVEEGVITEIKPASAGEGEGEGEGKKGEGDNPDEEKQKLQDRIEELEKENEDLKKELEEAKKNAKSAQDMATLNAIKMAGGAEKVLALAKSNYKPAGRSMDRGGKPNQKSGMEEELEKLKQGKLKNVNGKYVEVKD